VIRELQERAARAQPADHVEDADGWWLRYADTGAWWTGTVLPHAKGDLDGRIDGAERFYRERGAPARFQITPGACPPELDERLAERGYREESPVALMVAPARTVLLQLGGVEVDAHVTPHVTEQWLDVWQAAGGGDASAERALLERIDTPTWYAVEDESAVGRIVVDGSWAGVFGMATLPEARGLGKATAVLATLATLAGTRDADTLYLQVECSNDVATALYEKAGFIEVARYHYRAANGS
jgi:ribosomal protein S18 acetylase RimI-like enzyme